MAVIGSELILKAFNCGAGWWFDAFELFLKRSNNHCIGPRPKIMFNDECALLQGKSVVGHFYNCLCKCWGRKLINMKKSESCVRLLVRY